MRVLVWQWGRLGAGPAAAVALAKGMASLAGVEALLSLAAGAEIMQGPRAPRCDLPVATYGSMAGLIWRAAQAPWLIRRLMIDIGRLRPDCAVCALPGPLDLAMWAALRRLGIPTGVIVHDADPHPGDGFPGQFVLQRALVRRADTIIALTDHVAARLSERGDIRVGARLVIASLPPFDFGVRQPAGAHSGPRRVLVFGRLLSYKGLDLLLEALRLLGPRGDMEVRVAGKGPETSILEGLRRCPGVSVENRWIPEEEVGALLTWSDLLVLPYREASQSGVAAAALAAGRRIVVTRVGGLEQQLGQEPLAFLCEPDGKSLASAIMAALAEPADTKRLPVDAEAGWTGLARKVVDGLMAGGGAWPSDSPLP